MSKTQTSSARGIVVGLLCLISVSAFAHDGVHHATMGFVEGFMHPFSGLDHLLAMVAIGLWAAQNRQSALWVLPLSFPLMMIAGALLARSGVAVPMVETGIASSLAVLGLLIAFAVKMPVWLAATMVSVFGVLHGYAHGAEMSPNASIAMAGAGFVLATLLLHITGLSIGLFASSARMKSLIQLGGCGIILTGAYLLAV